MSTLGIIFVRYSGTKWNLWRNFDCFSRRRETKWFCFYWKSISPARSAPSEALDLFFWACIAIDREIERQCFVVEKLLLRSPRGSMVPEKLASSCFLGSPNGSLERLRWKHYCKRDYCGNRSCYCYTNKIKSILRKPRSFFDPMHPMC